MEERYRRRTPHSAASHAEAAQWMPGGDTRAATFNAPYPLTIDHGRGARLWDVDGNEYIDLHYNFTSLIHGNAYGPIVEAVADAVANGSAWAARSVPQRMLAEEICRRVPSIELLRFCNSGTEAAMLAAYLARSITGRSSIVKASAGYHGSYVELASQLESGGTPQSILDAEFGDAASFARVLADPSNDVAAVFLEPVMGAGGVVRAPEGFLTDVQEACREAGALFVLDEVITLRMASGGAQERFGLDPDLTILGKIIGGGFPVGALGGKGALMAKFDPFHGPALRHSGTFNGNPVTSSAGLVSLTDLTPPRIQLIDRQAAEIRRVLVDTAGRLRLPMTVNLAGSILNVHFLPMDDSPPRFDGAAARLRSFHLAGLIHGVYFSPRGMMSVATAMDQATVHEASVRLAAALEEISAIRVGKA